MCERKHAASHFLVLWFVILKEPPAAKPSHRSDTLDRNSLYDLLVSRLVSAGDKLSRVLITCCNQREVKDREEGEETESEIISSC